MGAADLDYVFEFFGFFFQRGGEFIQSRQQHIARGHGGGDMHGGGEGIIRGLTHIAMVIGVNGRFGADLAAQNLDRAVRDHLIGIHIRLRARTCLPHDQREMLIQLAINNLLRGGDHRICQLGGQFARSFIGLGTGAFDHAKRADHGDGLLFPTDGEIHQAALCLGAPIFVTGDLKRAKAVGFGTCGGHACSPVYECLPDTAQNACPQYLDWSWAGPKADQASICRSKR